MPKGRQRKLSPGQIEEAAVKAKHCFALKLVLMTVRVHPFPFRTRKLSSLVPTILGWKRPGTIGRRQHKYSSIAQPVEHATVNRRVVGSSPTWGARKAPDATHPGLLSYRFDSGPLHHLFSAASLAAIWLYTLSGTACNSARRPLLLCRTCPGYGIFYGIFLFCRKRFCLLWNIDTVLK